MKKNNQHDDSFIIFFSTSPRFHHIYGTCKNFLRIYNINKIEKTEKILRVQILMLGKRIFFNKKKNIYRYVYLSLHNVIHMCTHVSIQYCSCSKSCSTKYKNIYVFLQKYWNVLVMNFKVWYISHSQILMEKSLQFRFKYSQSLLGVLFIHLYNFLQNVYLFLITDIKRLYEQMCCAVLYLATLRANNHWVLHEEYYVLKNFIHRIRTICQHSNVCETNSPYHSKNNSQ